MSIEPLHANPEDALTRSSGEPHEQHHGGEAAARAGPSGEYEGPFNVGCGAPLGPRLEPSPLDPPSPADGLHQPQRQPARSPGSGGHSPATSRQHRPASGSRPRPDWSNNVSATTPPTRATGGRSSGRHQQQQQRGGRRDDPLGRSPKAANHLAGFRYHRKPSGSKREGRAARGGQAGRPRHYKKEHFLQANFRFAVSDRVDVQRHSSHADDFFEWEDVLQVEVTSTAPLQCPITLDVPPVAPVMTACGHVYSMPAIVHCMLDAGGENFLRAATCPLCYKTISARDLRLVTTRIVDAHGVAGATATFSLLRRPRTSILPRLAADDTSDSKAGPAPQAAYVDTTDGLAADRFSKFVLVSDPTPVFCAAAAELAHGAAALFAGCGTDAEVEGPSYFKGMDVLVSLAKAWVTRKIELEHEPQATQNTNCAWLYGTCGVEIQSRWPGPLNASGSLNDGSTQVVGAAGPEEYPEGCSPEAARTAVEESIRGVFNTEVQCEESRRQQVERQREAAAADHAAAAARDREQQRLRDLFPALPGTSPLQQPMHGGSWGGGSGGLEEGGVGTGGELSPVEHSSAAAEHSTLMFQLEGAGEGAGIRSSVSRDAVAAPEDASEVGSDGEDVGSLDEETQDARHMHSSRAADMFGRSPDQEVSVNQMSDEEFFMYQSSDGQLLFLHPINVRMLLSHFHSFKSCPQTLAGTILQIEHVTQDPVTRKRMKAVSHLPLMSEFRLCEVDLSSLLPDAVMQSFRGTLQERADRRASLADQERMEAERQAAVEASKAAARQVDLFELAAMPLPHESHVLSSSPPSRPADMSPLLSASTDPRPSRSPGEPMSYANLARLGPAAPSGPVVGGGVAVAALRPAAGAWAGSAVSMARSPNAAPVVPKGAWAAGRPGGGKPAGGGSGVQAEATERSGTHSALPAGPSRKNKKGQKVVLLTGGGRG